ncbi:MAG: chromosome condensation regulator [Thermoleophilia bacterium]|nr:chromosome condensation regulator [Thermoleophilia bacterium]
MRTRRLPSVLASRQFIVLIAIALVASAIGGATLVNDPSEGYTNVKFDTCKLSTNNASGNYDADGTLYVPCINTAGTSGMLVVKNGGAPTFAKLPAYYGDLAPSPHGEYLYTSNLKRLDRQADGTYKLSTTWVLESFPLSGKATTPTTGAVATDAFGNLYVAPAAIQFLLKYKPDGTLATAPIGDYTNTAEPGKFNLIAAVAPSRDGRTVYTIEKTGGRVQRFDLNADAVSYHYVRGWGGDDSKTCAKGGGNFAAPTDGAVDAWGFLYVMDTSCDRVQKFAPAKVDAAGKETADSNKFVYLRQLGTTRNLGATAKSHRIAVTITGDVYVIEQVGEVLKRSTKVPGAIPAITEPKSPVDSRTIAACPVEDWRVNGAGTASAVPAEIANGSGQSGPDGTTVVACKSSLIAFKAGATAPQRIAMPAGFRYYDVAPSPDFTYLYVTRDANVLATRKIGVEAVGGLPELVRFKRTGAAGTWAYALDATWKAKPFNIGGRDWTPCGRYIASDDYGNVYFSNGGWCVQYNAYEVKQFPTLTPSVIVKYDPAGDVVARFNGSKHGEMDVNMGIAVSRDGATVWEVEHVASRVQRYDRQADGNYGQSADPAALDVFGKKDDACGSADGFSAPYDIALDPWGFVYVANVSCRQVKKFTPAGKLVWTAAVPLLTHGIAVDRAGNVYATGSNRYLVDRAGAPGPVPPLTGPAPTDLLPPVFVSFKVTEATNQASSGLPADPFIVNTKQVTLKIAATDDVSGVGEVRFADENGTWKPWQAYSPTMPYTLHDGPNGLFIQLRDKAGRAQETSKYFVIRSSAPAVDPGNDKLPPVLVSLKVPEATNPASSGLPADPYLVPGTKVTLQFTATDDVSGVGEMRLATESGAWGAWQAFSTTYPYTIHDGSNGLFVQLRDKVGHEQAASTFFVIRSTAAPVPAAGADKDAPVLVSLKVPEATNPASSGLPADPYIVDGKLVTLKITATDDVSGVGEMRLADESGNWGAWKPFSPSFAYTLHGGSNGLFIQLRDKAGHAQDASKFFVIRSNAA